MKRIYAGLRVVSRKPSRAKMKLITYSPHRSMFEAAMIHGPPMGVTLRVPPIE